MSAIADAGALYRWSRLGLVEVLATATPERWQRPVPACPGWDVKAVVSHLVGVIEDGMAGRISGLPSPALTAEEVARHADDEPDELLATWERLAPPFEEVIAAREVWPPALDALTHQHDVRAALGTPGGRDDEAVELAATRLVEAFDGPFELQVDVGGGRVLRSATAAGPTYRLDVAAFEVLRLRLGRRSREQVRAMAWDPGPPVDVDALFVFGPRAEALAA